MPTVHDLPLNYCYSVPSCFNDFLLSSEDHYCCPITTELFYDGKYFCDKCKRTFFLRYRPQDGELILLNDDQIHFLNYVEAEDDFDKAFKSLGICNMLTDEEETIIIERAKQIGPLKLPLSEFEKKYFDFYFHPERFFNDTNSPQFSKALYALIKLQKVMSINCYSPLIFYEYLLLYKLLEKSPLLELPEYFFNIYTEQKEIINHRVFDIPIHGKNYSISYSNQYLSTELIEADIFKSFLITFVDNESYENLLNYAY
jgi:hypothetical protein